MIGGSNEETILIFGSGVRTLISPQRTCEQKKKKLSVKFALLLLVRGQTTELYRSSWCSIS